MKRGILLVSLTVSLYLAQMHAHAQIAASAPPFPSGHPHDATRDEYRTHLEQLETLVAVCAKARDLKACNPADVGPDDQILTDESNDASRRLIRYGWLRVLLSKAQDPDAPPPKPPVTQRSEAWANVRPTPPTTTQLLQAAQTRLAHELAHADQPAAVPAAHVREREVMNEVLAGRDFQDLGTPSAQDAAMEKVGNWLNRALEGALRASARAPWLGRVLVWGFITSICVALALVLWRLERRWRIRLIPERSAHPLLAASAIPWQQWLERARAAADAGQWREAIHFLYWAAISRLEAKRLWPADRARTPREYLSLVAADDPRKSDLATLTRSFERTWYGGLDAAEADYRRAESIVTTLISGHAGAAAPEGGRP